MRFIKIEIIWFLNVCIQYQQENCDTKPGFAVTIQNLVGVPFCQPHTHLIAHHFHHFNNQILLLKNSVENHIDYISYLHRQTGWYLGTSRYLIRKDDPYLLKQPQPERGTGCSLWWGHPLLHRQADKQMNRQTGWHPGTIWYLIRQDVLYLLERPLPERGAGCSPWSGPPLWRLGTKSLARRTHRG